MLADTPSLKPSKCLFFVVSILIPSSFILSKDVDSLFLVILSGDISEIADYASAIHWLAIFADKMFCFNGYNHKY
jgi:hypothetical protein